MRDPLAVLRGDVPEAPSPTAPAPSDLREVVSPQDRGRALARRLVGDKAYLRGLRERLREGKAGASTMELMLWARAFGEVEKGASVTTNVGVTVVKPW